MRKLRNLFGAMMLLVTALALTGCGLSDNALEEIINNINSSPGNEEEETVIIPYTCRDYKEGTIQADNSVTFAKATRDTDPTKLTDATTDQTWAGWYYVEGNVTIGAPGSEVTITLSDETHLILCDGATLTINGMINGGTSAPYQNLYIYGQATGDGKMVVSNTGTYPVFINLNTWQIHGGEITASVTGTGNIITSGFDMLGGKLIAEKSSTDAGGYAINVNDANVDINVYGGIVNAKGSGNQNAGICVYYQKKLFIYGGEVTAIGLNRGSHGVQGSVEVSGTGTLTATGAKGVLVTSPSTGYSGGCGIQGSLTTTTNSSGYIKITGGDGADGFAGGQGISADLIANGSGTIEVTGGNGDGNQYGGYGINGKMEVNGSSNITVKGGNSGSTGGNGGFGITKYLTTGTGYSGKISITGGNGSVNGGAAIWGSATNGTSICAINYGGGVIVAKGGTGATKNGMAVDNYNDDDTGSCILTSSATNYYTWDGTTWTSAGSVNGVSAAISARGVALPTMPTE